MEERDDIVEGTLSLGPVEEPTTYFGTASLSTPRIKFDKTEFCFQFDDDEPIVFALGGYGADTDNVTFTINNSSDGYITFTGLDNKTLKIFAREHTNG
jgi:hypothetical protein